MARSDACRGSSTNHLAGKLGLAEHGEYGTAGRGHLGPIARDDPLPTAVGVTGGWALVCSQGNLPGAWCAGLGTVRHYSPMFGMQALELRAKARC
jgi:hypothetical protein